MRIDDEISKEFAKFAQCVALSNTFSNQDVHLDAFSSTNSDIV